MKFLVDENMPVRVMYYLKKLGHDATRTPLGWKNGKILGLASDEQRIVISLDNDFLDTKRYPPRNYYGIICLRIHPPRPDALIGAMDLILSQVKTNEFQGTTFRVKDSEIERFH